MEFHEHLAQLRAEGTIFERLMYKCKNQHRASFHFRKLHEVRRSLRLLQKAASDDVLATITLHLQPPKRGARRTDKGQKSEARENLLSSLLGISRILHEINSPLLDASRLLAGLLEQGFFIAFGLTFMSVLARIRVLSLQLLVDTVTVYNKIAAVLHSGDSLLPFSRLRQELPASLECKWDGVRYELHEHKASSETWFADDRSGNQPLKNAPKILYESAGKPLSSSLKMPPPPPPSSSTPGAPAADSTIPAAAADPGSQSRAAAEFLDFLKAPTRPSSSKRVAYVAVGKKLEDTAKKPREAAADSNASSISAPQKDALFDLLLSGRNNESIF